MQLEIKIPFVERFVYIFTSRIKYYLFKEHKQLIIYLLITRVTGDRNVYVAFKFYTSLSTQKKQLFSSVNLIECFSNNSTNK